MPRKKKPTYFEYLLQTVNFDKPEFMVLMERLHEETFIPVIPRDINRAEDGKYLRTIYCDDFNTENAPGGFPDACTVLEMLVMFAVRIDREYTSETLEDHPEIMFWEMLDNLGLTMFDEDNFDENEVDFILKRWLNIEYDRNGNGSLFPVRKTKFGDMRKRDLWQQMNIYLNENH